MKNIKKVLLKTAVSLVLTAVIALSSLNIGIKGAETKTVKGLQPQIMYADGEYVYFCHPGNGCIYKTNFVNSDSWRLAINPGPVYGFTSLVVKGKYIYAEASLADGSDGHEVGARLYRMTLDGKKKKVIIDRYWGGFTIAGSRIYYNDIEGGYDYDGEKGAARSVKLNGTDVQSAEGIKVKASKSSAAFAGSWSSKKVLKASSGGYKYTVKKGHLSVSCNGEDIYVIDKTTNPDEIITGIVVHKDKCVIIENNKNPDDGLTYEYLYFIGEPSGKNFYLASYLPGD